MTGELKPIIERSEKNLERVLAWVTRQDIRHSVLLSLNIAVLGSAAVAAPAFPVWTWKECAAALTTGVLIAATFFCLFRAQYPRVDAPNNSLLYFGTVAKLTFDEFDARAKAGGDAEYLRDLLHQIYANAKIVDAKVRWMSRAMIALVLSLLPWALTIYVFKAR